MYPVCRFWLQGCIFRSSYGPWPETSGQGRNLFRQGQTQIFDLFGNAVQPKAGQMMVPYVLYNEIY